MFLSKRLRHLDKNTKDWDAPCDTQPIQSAIPNLQSAISRSPAPGHIHFRLTAHPGRVILAEISGAWAILTGLTPLPSGCGDNNMLLVYLGLLVGIILIVYAGLSY